MKLICCLTFSVTLLLTLLTGPAGLAVRGAESPSEKPGKPEKGATKGAAFKNVGVEQFDKLRADPKSVVLDVRTKKEFDSGHIPGAINVDWQSPDFEKQVSALDRDKTYLVHCAGGVRSVKACNAMSRLQFKNCYNLEAGFKSWEKAGKPVKK